MSNYLFWAFVFFLPAGVANMTPVLANKIPYLNRWNTPMDFGKSHNGIRIFGDHKTWRGFVTGITCGTLVGLLIYHNASMSVGDRLLWFGLPSAMMGAGALLGDAVKSFFKRRVGIPSGKSWFPFDQMDYIIGGLLFTLPFGAMPLKFAAAIFLEYFLLHPVFTCLGYLLHLKKDPI